MPLQAPNYHRGKIAAAAATRGISASAVAVACATYTAEATSTCSLSPALRRQRRGDQQPRGCRHQSQQGLRGWLGQRGYQGQGGQQQGQRLSRLVAIDVGQLQKVEFGHAHVQDVRQQQQGRLYVATTKEAVHDTTIVSLSIQFWLLKYLILDVHMLTQPRRLLIRLVCQKMIQALNQQCLLHPEQISSPGCVSLCSSVSFLLIVHCQRCESSMLYLAWIR